MTDTETCPKPENHGRCAFGAGGDETIHCHCWFEGDECCKCNDPEMTDEQREEQGMDFIKEQDQ
jgi:hypothetical protein